MRHCFLSGLPVSCLTFSASAPVSQENLLEAIGPKDERQSSKRPLRRKPKACFQAVRTSDPSDDRRKVERSMCMEYKSCSWRIGEPAFASGCRNVAPSTRLNRQLEGYFAMSPLGCLRKQCSVPECQHEQILRCGLAKVDRSPGSLEQHTLESANQQQRDMR